MNQEFNIECLILAGGKGSRLKQISGDTPKPLMKVAKKPFIYYLLDLLKTVGVKKVYISICFNSRIFREKLLKKYKNIDIVLIDEKFPLGTGGSIINFVKFIKKKNILVMNGDSYAKINLKKFISTYEKRNFDGLVAMNKSIKNETRYGSIKLGEKNRILKFSEKTKIKTNYINAGIYLFKKKIFSSFNQSKKYSLEYDLFKQIIKNYEIYGWPFATKLIDIGTPSSFVKASKYFKK